MILSEFSQAEIIIQCPRKIICNNCEQMNVSVDILNAGRNAEYQEYCGFTALFFKITTTVTYEITKNKLMEMQLGNLISQRGIDNIYIK